MDKYTLTIKEAGAYFGIGIKKLQHLAADNLGVFAIKNGKKNKKIRKVSRSYKNRVRNGES